LAKKLIDSKDIIEDLIDVVAPKYFPAETLDTSRTSIMGYLTEAMADSVEDTVTLEQRRAAEYCPELSNSIIHVNQTAKLRGVEVHYAQPGIVYVQLMVLKNDILTKGTPSSNGNEVTFIIDHRSTIVHQGVPYSLDDDIVIRAVKRSGKTIYAASYAGDRTVYDSYLQMFDTLNDQDEETISLLVLARQFQYNIEEHVITDPVQFLYDGEPFDYSDKLAGFDVYYKNSSTDEFSHLDKTHYLTTVATDSIYYNDDDTGIIYIINNPRLNIGTNATIKVEIMETLGEDGMVPMGDGEASFSLYRDGSYNYTGVYVEVRILSDTVNASDGDTISDIKKALIDAKTRRDNITTEHDIVTYVNDIDANIQIVKKRNDIEDRRYYIYTLLRHNDAIVSTATIRAIFKGVVNPENWGDMTIYGYSTYDPRSDRKIIRAHNKYKLMPADNICDTEYVTPIDPDEPEEEGAYYYTSPFMLLLNKYNVASYYYCSVNDNIQLAQKSLETVFPFQMIVRSVQIYRNSHDSENFDIYRFTITGTLNTSSDEDLLDDDGNIKDLDAIRACIVFRKDNTGVAYMMMNIDSYDSETREFTFIGTMRTTDFITEDGYLEIINGLLQVRTETNYYSVIDYANAFFDVYFFYKHEDYADYTTGDVIFQQLPSTQTDGYALMCGYYNTPANPYNLMLEYSKFTSSPVQVIPRAESDDQTISNEEYQKMVSDLEELQNTRNTVALLGGDGVSQETVDATLAELDASIEELKDAIIEVRKKTTTSYLFSVGEFPLIEYQFGIANIINMYDTFEHLAEVYGTLITLTTDFDVSLKFINTYGRSKYIHLIGGRNGEGAETDEMLNNLNPTFYFKIYGKGVDVDTVREFIYEYLRDNYITEGRLFISNVCTIVEDTFTAIKSIKYMGVDDSDASYQQFSYEPPEFTNIELITKFIPEQLNVTDIRIELDET